MEMSCGGADSRWHKEPRVRRDCTLTPPDKYDWAIFAAAAAMRSVATVTVATWFKSYADLVSQGGHAPPPELGTEQVPGETIWRF